MNKLPSVNDVNNLEADEGEGASRKPDSPTTLHVPADFAGMRLDAALARLYPEFSRARLAAWIKEEHILVNNEPSIPKQKIIGGEKIEFFSPTSPENLAFKPEPLDLNIVFEDEDILVLNKPAGLVVHPGSGNWSGTLLNGLLNERPELAGVPRAGIVHRLDKDTSGLMVVAKNLTAQNALVKELQARSVKRLYRALAYGAVPYDGKIATLIGRDPRNRLKMAVLPASGKEAITHVEVLDYLPGTTYIECSLETGRTHQIRLHLSHAGYPLVGDPLYKSNKTLIKADKASLEALSRFKRQALHAKSLSFTHPRTGEKLRFNSPLPPDMAALLAELKKNRDGEFPDAE